jgi:hypothetical protein
MVNLFPEAIPEGGKEPGFLNRAPGLRLLANMGDGPIRGLWQFGGYGYAVSGEVLYKIDSLWNVSVRLALFLDYLALSAWWTTARSYSLLAMAPVLSTTA